MKMQKTIKLTNDGKLNTPQIEIEFQTQLLLKEIFKAQKRLQISDADMSRCFRLIGELIGSVPIPSLPDNSSITN